MVFCDGEEVDELVDSYILTKFDFRFDKKILSLYGSDGLGVFRNLLGPEIEKTRQEIIKVFKHCDLSITAKTNLKKVDFEFKYHTTHTENLLIFLFT